MGHCSLRSLLVAAIVVSNCITWTASRHHYTHNVHGHRSRHRRQGAGLYLSSSYVIPGGEGSGAWGEWGEVSPCSRTCGGGVASQKRICLEIEADGQPRCTGGDTKYFSCETQDCPDATKDFRAEQCSQYDNVAFKGIKYTWVPYTKGPNPCELNCMPRGERFYYRQQSKVVDGTRCNEDSFDVCVDGTCQPVGCDFMLGSSAREDRCRECRGNGANCHTVSDLHTQELRNGYNDILLIPQGATSINIEEIKPSSNYLALRAKNNTYYLNGDYHIDFPRSITIAGATWQYDRSQNGLPSPDKLRCLGPTDEPLFLSLLLQEPNVGIKYEYSVPKAMAPPPNQQYNWVHGEFTPCSASCGGGFQTRDVSCRSREELEVVDEGLCNEAFRPAANQSCATNPCAAKWVEGPWGPCSKPCGEGGSRARRVHCEKIIKNGYPSIVADKECFELLGPQPPLFETCNQNATCPTWFTGAWKPCDKLCDEGKQTRQVVCYQKNEGKIEVLDDELCMEEKPPVEQKCMLHPCDGVDWILTDWVGCDTCLSTFRTRTAVCSTKSSFVVNDSLCAYHPVPVLEKPCDKTKLPACEVQWYATQWSKCSAECGKGVQTRRVFCGLFDGASVVKVDDNRCDQEAKYNDTKPCEIAKCPSKWYAGPWSKCSATCGGGMQNRFVTCLSNGEVTTCDADTVLNDEQSCNLGPCNEDKLIPLSPSSAPITDGYEDEICEDDEDYPEVGAELDSSLTTLDIMMSDSPSTGLSTSYGENESEFTTDSGSGLETLEGSGFGSTESTEFTDEGSGTEGTGSTESTETEETTKTSFDETGSTETSLGSSSLTSESTVVKESASTDMESSKSTDESESTVAGDTDSTESTLDTSTPIIDYDYTDESAVSGSTDSTDSTTTEVSGSTVSGATESSLSSESDSTGSSASESSTESNLSSTTENTDETESTVSGETSESSYSDETSESSSSDETTETSSEESTLSTSSESEATEETAVSGSTEASGSTESSISTEAGSTKPSGSTEAGSTEPTGSTESTVSGATEVSGSAETTSEGGSTEPESTESTSSSESAVSTEVSGSTESPGTTETGLTESSGPTEATEAAATDETGSTETSVATTESTGSTETGSTAETETEETGSTESYTTEGGSTEASTEGSTVSGTIETGSTETGSTDTKNTEETTSASGSTTYDWTTTLEIITTAKSRCKPRASKCAKTKFGCCPDRKTAATGPFDEGCLLPMTCAKTSFGCCPDGVSPARGPHHKGCPVEACQETLFGCCKSDNKTAAEGNDQEGCPPPPPACKSSKYGCCKDEQTAATGPKKKGCPETKEAEAPTPKPGEAATTTALPEGVLCNATEFGCCPDGVTAAAGSQMEGCVMSCNSSAYGCCPDGETPAHGYNYEGCCLLYPFGCCPDNFKPAEGPHLEGCGCQFSRYGCCPDNVTLASGPSNEGCGCEYTEYGCCPDRHTPASGPEFAGCGCHTYQFGCCEDGATIAKGPNMQGCLCHHAEFGCCGDEKTPATGPGQAGCDCSTSKYGCCPDGETAALGTKFLGCTDKPEIRQAACALSRDRGPCTNYSVYWYYDLQYGGCSRFWYGGCEGNGNRFTSKEECEDVCVSPAPTDACNLPMVKGACTGYHPRWYYDAERENCGQFIFGGCLGNANNFDSRELCQKQCEPEKSEDQCSQTIDGGTCRGNFLRWGWSADNGRCEQFVWGGCEGNANRFGSEAACLHRCNPPGVPKPRCKQPREAGNCTEKHALWAFSQSEDRCVPFYYSGCGGNDNRFDSRTSCAEACPSSFVKDTCMLPAVTGECADYTEKWYYDTAIKRCRQFYYGGCGGNENRFSTQLECENQCSELRTTTLASTTLAPTAPGDVCSLPSMTGECDDYKEKWFFDYNSNRCRQFYYGGCGGNGNRFESESQCEARCVPARTAAAPTSAPAPSHTPAQAPEQTAELEVCFMSPEPGPCAELQPRWAYDAARGVCVRFMYGGCGGNQNNFPDRDYCQQACGATQDVCQLPMLAGPCEESLMRWFYDTSSDACSQFAYSGCEGNDNRFESLEACEQRCRRGPPPARSDTTPAPGEEHQSTCQAHPEADEECEGAGLVWYLDVTRRTCVSHENQASGRTCRRSGVHRTEEACERTCGAFRDLEVCRYPVDPGPCRGAIPKYYFDESAGGCVEFAYGGCHGGANRFSSMEECMDVCTFRNESTTTSTTTLAPWENPEPQAADEQCVTPTSFEAWACDATSPRYYYDAELRECVLSAYGDCGHTNAYLSEEECERTCGAFRGLDPCRSPLDVGHCNSAIPKFYWKLSAGRCEPFAYSGCGGGANRFSSADECRRVCGSTGPELACLQPLDAGEACEETPSRRWYYSEPAAQCQAFVYRGCGGSANNFRSPGACAHACHTTLDEGNEVLPDCDLFNEECARLRCQFGVQRTRAPGGCERCACVPVDVDCAPLVLECQTLKCAYGMRRTMGEDGCERCTCNEHPCANQNCPSGQRCVASAYRNPITQEIEYTPDCHVENKPGSCPSEEASPSPADALDACRRECNDDADCRGVGKCCARGCSQLCLEPASPTASTSPRPPSTTYVPELPQAPQANPVTEPEVKAEEGGKATLRCLFHGNPPPKITWRRGEITIDGDVGRYRLLSDGALEIVSLFRNDTGVYICVAENVHGSSQQEIRLQVNDPVETPAGISGEPDAVLTGELGRSLNVRCLAYGHPPPSIYWYRGSTMLPYSSELYEARENVLQIRKLAVETLGEYACQAFNGVGRPAVWAVTVRAYRPDERWAHALLVPRAPLQVDITPARAAAPASTPPPEIDVPVYTVAVNTNIPFEQRTQPVGGELSLPCDVDGYPLPEVYWTKDDARLSPDARTQITDARLTIAGLTEQDSGVYGCHARNGYSSHSSTIQITVQGVYIPMHCTDNPFFADCKLIVRSKFCNHQYYSKFCCESCVKAGQLNALEMSAQADAAWTRRK